MKFQSEWSLHATIQQCKWNFEILCLKFENLVFLNHKTFISYNFSGQLLQTYEVPSIPFKVFMSVDTRASNVSDQTVVSVYLVFMDDVAQRRSLTESNLYHLQIKMDVSFRKNGLTQFLPKCFGGNAALYTHNRTLASLCICNWWQQLRKLWAVMVVATPVMLHIGDGIRTLAPSVALKARYRALLTQHWAQMGWTPQRPPAALTRLKQQWQTDQLPEPFRKILCPWHE